MPQASTMAPKTMYGAPRNSGLAPSATTDSFQNSLCSVRYGSQSGGALRLPSQARHWFTSR